MRNGNNLDLTNPLPAMVTAARTYVSLPENAPLPKRQRLLTQMALALSAVDAHAEALATLNVLLAQFQRQPVTKPPRPLIMPVADTWTADEREELAWSGKRPTPRVLGFAPKRSALFSAAMELGLTNAWKAVGAALGYDARTSAVLRHYHRHRRQRDSAEAVP